MEKIVHIVDVWFDEFSESKHYPHNLHSDQETEYCQDPRILPGDPFKSLSHLGNCHPIVKNYIFETCVLELCLFGFQCVVHLSPLYKALFQSLLRLSRPIGL